MTKIKLPQTFHLLTLVTYFLQYTLQRTWRLFLYTILNVGFCEIPRISSLEALLEITCFWGPGI